LRDSAKKRPSGGDRVGDLTLPNHTTRKRLETKEEPSPSRAARGKAKEDQKADDQVDP